MPTYEGLLDEALARGLTVIERYPFTSPRIRGLCCDDVIALSEKIDTEAERRVVLCEELTHAMHSAGNILDDPRMEQKARTRNFDRLVGLRGLICAFLAGCRESWEFAEALGVTPSYLTGWEQQPPHTLAAHFEGEEFSEDELREIEDFVRFVKSRRKR